ncbi:DNA-binding transcriptional regulator, AcrR family [Methylocapsa palsarum]|uniref:DNA-binding transcriptional regulator, AcrR family n=2 Tax=Methylocapsa palsarum TaxID=1612308 RepID=A0A1I4B0W3_9HYPH|nr:TetR family transcriptional regulator [Methylocapsa palsarum]SFK62415.1 DNA-binding transcriptional regulator, AcrR family [Methylocapsa palsarum]
MKNVTELKEQGTQLSIVEVAENLFRQLGFQKTTVADIARELQMSPANVYRFFASKSEINEAVARRLLVEIETAVKDVAKSRGPASKNIHNIIATIETLNAQRFSSDRKLHDLLETAYNEHWPIVAAHIEVIDKALAQVLSAGMAAGEFKKGDAELIAILVRSACVRFCHPRLMVECAQDPEPTIDQMMAFLIGALK